MASGFQVYSPSGGVRLDGGDRQVKHYQYFSGYLANGNSTTLSVGGGYNIGNGDWGLDVTPVDYRLKAVSTSNTITVTANGESFWYRINVFKLNEAASTGYGFRSISNSGFNQIDEKTVGYQVLATGSLAGSGNYSMSRLTIPSTYPNDIIVVAKPKNPATNTSYRLFSNFEDFYIGTTRYRYVDMNAAAGSSVLATEPVDYAIIQRCGLFDDSLISNQTPANYGFNVYQSNGDLSFTTEKPTFRVRAARHHEITTSSLGAATWHTTSNQTDLLNTYAMAHGYGEIKRRVFGPSADRQFAASARLAKWDYPNNTFGTDIISYSGQVSSGTSTFNRVWEGHRTEMVGYVV